MRRKDREVTKTEELLQIIDKCKVCRIGMLDDGQVYIVPLNFGYIFENNQLSLYFHSAKEGKKLDIIKKNNNVCFEMDGEHKLTPADTPCRYSYAWESVIGNGWAEFIEDAAEKIKALNILMKHQTGTDFVFDEKAAQSVAVFKITATSISGKKHE